MYAVLLFRRSEPARDGLEDGAGTRLPAFSLTTIASGLAPTGALANEVDLARPAALRNSAKAAS